MKKRILSVLAILLFAFTLQQMCKADMEKKIETVTGEEMVPLSPEIESKKVPKCSTVYDLAIFDEDPPEPEEVHPYLQMPVLLTLEEQDLLLRVAMAEAEGEDVKGQALVMRVVLNRCITSNKGVRAVIYQPKQFATNRMTLKPNEGAYEALSMVIDGWDESQGALYFCSKGYSKYGEPLFQHGGHYFSK